MKQFVLATKVVTSGKVTTPGQVIVANTVGADFFQIIVGHGDNIVPDTFVVYKKDLRWDKTEYKKGTTYEAEVTCEVETDKYNETHVVISKCGAVFNERNVWTASGHGKTANDVAKSLAKNINFATATHGLTAEASGAKVTLKAADGDFTDYIVVGKNTSIPMGCQCECQCVCEHDAEVTVKSKGMPGVGDKADILNRAHACIGDKGIGYTSVEAMLDTTNFYLPSLADDVKYNIYTLSFYNPRYDHRIDEPLFQKIHVAIPTSADASALENAIADKDAKNQMETSEAPSDGGSSDTEDSDTI